MPASVVFQNDYGEKYHKDCRFNTMEHTGNTVCGTDEIAQNRYNTLISERQDGTICTNSQNEQDLNKDIIISPQRTWIICTYECQISLKAKYSYNEASISLLCRL